MSRWRPTTDITAADLERGIDRATLRRAVRFARPYRGLIILHLAGLAATSLAAVLPPLVLKALVDRADAGTLDTGVINWLVAAAVSVALVTTGLGLLNRWLGSRIGEGLIYDLRVALFEHVQRMPVAFFTHTQTGSLLSRLSNDVLGAQQVVGTLATVTSDIFTLITTLTAMLILSWKVTLLALLVIPGFVVLDRRMARRLAALSRTRMVSNAQMSSNMAERFNVAGALLVKLFGRPRAEAAEFAERADAVRASGVKLAVTSRLYYGSLALVGAIGTAAVYWVGGGNWPPAPSDRDPDRPGRLRGPALLTPHRPGWRPGRSAHRPGQLRACLRGPRRPARGGRRRAQPLPTTPACPTGPDRGGRRVVPLPVGRHRVHRVARG